MIIGSSQSAVGMLWSNAAGSVGSAGASGDPRPLLSGIKHQGEVQDALGLERLVDGGLRGLVGSL